MNFLLIVVCSICVLSIGIIKQLLHKRVQLAPITQNKSNFMKQIFVCTKCDGQFPKWSGRCEQCGSWGTISQDPVSPVPTTAKTEHKQALSGIQAATPVTFSNISTGEVDRISTHMQECDRVFGGGIVPGSLVLLGGDPGIGRATLS